MKLSIIIALIRLAGAILGWLERQRIKAEGRAEAYAEAKEIHDRRVAEANAARADADDLDPERMRLDPHNRDTRG